MYINDRPHRLRILKALAAVYYKQMRIFNPTFTSESTPAPVPKPVPALRRVASQCRQGCRRSVELHTPVGWERRHSAGFVARFAGPKKQTPGGDPGVCVSRGESPGA